MSMVLEEYYEEITQGYQHCDKVICHRCIGDKALSNYIKANGTRRECSYLQDSCWDHGVICVQWERHAAHANNAAFPHWLPSILKNREGFHCFPIRIRRLLYFNRMQNSILLDNKINLFLV